MSLFTKIFVVLNMVVSVLLVGLVVAFATNVETYKDKFNNEKTQSATFQLEAKNRESESLAAYNAANTSISQLQSEVEALRAELNQKNTLVLQQESDNATLRLENDRFTSELSKLSGGAEQTSQLLAQLSAEVDRWRDSESKLSIQVVDLSQKLGDKTTESEQLTRQLRLFLENNNELTRQLREMGAKVDSMAGLGGQEETGPLNPLSRGTQPDRPIRAMVTGMKQIGDQTFVQLNVGSNDGVEEGMQFTIHKGDTFQATVIVKAVDLNESGAQVTLVRGAITPGESEAHAGPES